MTEITQPLIEAPDKLAAAIRARLRPGAPAKREVGVHAKRELPDLMHGIGIDKPADQHPAINLAASQPDMPMAQAMEATRLEGLRNGRSSLSQRRQAVARQRAQRRAQIDAIEQDATKPDAERLRSAWGVVLLMHPTFQRIARSKAQWAGRYLGDVSGDVVALAEESVVLILARDTRDLDDLLTAAHELSDVQRATGMVPGDQSASALTEEQRKHRKRIRRARKWLMSVINHRVMCTLADLYRERNNLRWDNLDIIDTVFKSISGAGDDPLLATFKVSTAPSFLGTKFPRPGGVDGNLVQTAFMAAITDRGLDRMVELLLSETVTRTNGSIAWSEHAKAIFLSAPDDLAEYRWQLVCERTKELDRPRHARGKAAQRFVRQQFEWVPAFLVAVVDAFDQQADEWYVTKLGQRAHMGSLFEQYLPASDGRRHPLRPALTFATPEEAARVLREHMAELLRGDDLLDSLSHA